MDLKNKIFISYGTDKYDPSRIKPIEVDSKWGRVHNKPHGGLWASPVDSSFSWGDFCNREAFNLKSLNKHFIFKLKPESKICIIDNIDDLVKYSSFDNYLGMHTLYIKKIVSLFDGLYVSDNAVVELRHIDLKLRLNSLDSWDIESICIWNPDIVEPIEENAFEKASHHKYEKPLYNSDEEEYYWDFDNLNDRKKLQIDADFERYRNTNVEDSRNLFKGEHPALLAQKHGNSKDAKLARKFNGTIKSGMNENKLNNMNENKKTIRLSESDLHRIIKKSVNMILNEISYDKAKDAYYTSYDNMVNNIITGKKLSDRKRKQVNNLYNHMNDRRTENIDLNMPAIIVGGKYQGHYTIGEILDKFPISGYADAFENSRYKDSKIVGYPRIKGLIGPMWDGDKIRYETQEVYDELSI